jgi:hypothetical protein
MENSGIYGKLRFADGYFMLKIKDNKNTKRERLKSYKVR